MGSERGVTKRVLLARRKLRMGGFFAGWLGRGGINLFSKVAAGFLGGLVGKCGRFLNRSSRTQEI